MANQVGVIGVGVMGEALVAALIRSGVAPSDISFAEKRAERAAELVSKYSIVNLDLNSLVAKSDVLLLVMKPQDMDIALLEIAPNLRRETLVISFAAGKKISYIASTLNSSNAIVRVMPNTPALLGAGAAGYSFGAGVTDAQREFVRTFMAATGVAIEVPENLQEAVTATSGSGPAYFFRFVEAMVDGGVALGLSREDATTLTIQTITGAAKMLNESGDSPTTLREKVTSPNGTTAAALATFNAAGISEIVAAAMKASADRSIELA